MMANLQVGWKSNFKHVRLAGSLVKAAPKGETLADKLRTWLFNKVKSIVNGATQFVTNILNKVKGWINTVEKFMKHLDHQAHRVCKKKIVPKLLEIPCKKMIRDKLIPWLNEKIAIAKRLVNSAIAYLKELPKKLLGKFGFLTDATESSSGLSDLMKKLIDVERCVKLIIL